jgi:hypothetical protein
MIQLDGQLIYEAQRRMNGANVHLLKQMIFAYEQAVDLHNAGWPGHKVYQTACEEELRDYLMSGRSRRRSTITLRVGDDRRKRIRWFRVFELFSAGNRAKQR